MKIKIIGYTSNLEKGYLPEAISAGFARVSRRKEPVSFLVEEAQGDLEKARRSNTTIIHEYGHSSIAEHVVFNVVVEEVSRLLSAIIMSHRLNSYIEKSQRYVDIDTGFVVPKEFSEEDAREYSRAMKELFSGYDFLYKKLGEYLKEKYPDWTERDVNNRAKEDARFVLPLSTFTQFGMTINARNFEHLAMRLKSQNLDEAEQAAELLVREGTSLAPSVIKYTEENSYFKETYGDIEQYVKENLRLSSDSTSSEAVKLVGYDDNPDDKVVTALLHRVSKLGYDSIKASVARLPFEQKKEIITTALKKLKPHDTVLREFEFPSFTFELLISQCCYHQLLRHRMCTYTLQEENADLGFVVPPLITGAGLESDFTDIIKKSTELYNYLKQKYPKAAKYALSNAHKVRVLFKANIRELYHFSRIRAEKYAQWEIRDLAKEMVRLANQHAPLSMCLSCGRSDFEKQKSKIIGL